MNERAKNHAPTMYMEDIEVHQRSSKDMRPDVEEDVIEKINSMLEEQAEINASKLPFNERLQFVLREYNNQKEEIDRLQEKIERLGQDLEQRKSGQSQTELLEEVTEHDLRGSSADIINTSKRQR